MELRRMEDGDIAQISELVHEHRKASEPDLDGSVKEEAAIIIKETCRSDSSHLLVVSEGSEIMGFIHFHIIPFPMIVGRECYISDLLVKDEERGNGVGSILLDAAERIAKKMECSRMMLNNLKDADSYKMEFYKKKGFTEREGVANFVKVLP